MYARADLTVNTGDNNSSVTEQQQQQQQQQPVSSDEPVTVCDKGHDTLQYGEESTFTIPTEQLRCVSVIIIIIVIIVVFRVGTLSWSGRILRG